MPTTITYSEWKLTEATESGFKMTKADMKSKLDNNHKEVKANSIKKIRNNTIKKGLTLSDFLHV